MPARPLPDKFQVAFSFAGEQRALVRSIAEAVERELGEGQVFFDEWYEHYIAGDDADLKLQEIYDEGCALAVVCVSERYGGKPWTKAEHRAIRARQLRASDRNDELCILPIRVGEGDVPGILFNSIVPDVRQRSPAETRKLVLDRLYLARPDLRPSASESPDWPESLPPLDWPMADHSEVREAFARLLTQGATCRFLPVAGPSEVGKSHITNQMLSNALRVSGLACGRLDFKGTANLDNALGAFVELLGVERPSGSRLSERLGQVIAALKKKERPTLLVFDTYELASGEEQDWLEKQLLLALIRAPWLRVVVAGQKVPDQRGAAWAATAVPTLKLVPPPPEDWLAYGLPHKPGIDLEFVRRAHHCCGGKASLLAELLGPAT